MSRKKWDDKYEMTRGPRPGRKKSGRVAGQRVGKYLALDEAWQVWRQWYLNRWGRGARLAPICPADQTLMLKDSARPSAPA